MRPLYHSSPEKESRLRRFFAGFSPAGRRFSPRPESGAERCAPGPDAPYLGPPFPAPSRPEAEAQPEACRLVNPEGRHAERSCSGFDPAVRATEPDGVRQMLAIARGSRVEVFRYAGGELPPEHPETLFQAVA